MPKWESYNRAALTRGAEEEISEGKEEYKREEAGRKGPLGKYWNDEDIEAVYGGDNYDYNNDDSGYRMHGVYYDEAMQMLEESCLKGDFGSVDIVLGYYKHWDNIELVLKNVVVGYLFLPKDQSDSSLKNLADFLKKSKTSRTKELSFSLPRFLDSPEIEELIINELGERENEEYENEEEGGYDYFKHINDLNISLKKKEKLVSNWTKVQLKNGWKGYTQELKNQILAHFRNFDFTELEEAALAGLKEVLSNRDMGSFSYLMTDSLIPPDKIDTPEMIKVVIDSFWDCLSSGNIDKAVEIRKQFEFLNDMLDSPEIEEKILSELINNLSRGDVKSAINIKDNFNISPEKINSPEVEQAALAGLSNCLTNRYIHLPDALIIKDNFNISSEKLELVAIKGIINCLSTDDSSGAREIKENFPISREKLSSPEIEQAAEALLDRLLAGNSINSALELKNNFPISPERQEQLVLKNIIRWLSQEMYSKAIMIKKNFSVSPENINCLEVNQAALVCLDKFLINGRIEDGAKIKDAFSLSSEKLEDIALKNVIDHLSQGRYNEAIEVKNNFCISKEKLSSPEVEEAASACLDSYLSATHLAISDTKIIYDTKIIRNNFPISPEKVEEIAMKNFISRLATGDTANAFAIKKIFNISQEKIDSSETEDAALAGIISCLLGGKITEALRIEKDIKAPAEKRNSPKVNEAAIVCLDKLMSEFFIDMDKIADLEKNFTIAPEKAEDIALKNLKNQLLKFDADSAIRFKNKFKISPEKLNSSEIEQAVLACLDKALSKGKFSEVLELKKAFAASWEKTRPAALKNIISYLTMGDVDRAIRIKVDFFGLMEQCNSSEVEQSVKFCLKNIIRQGRVNQAIRIRKYFVILPEEFEKLFFEGLIDCLLVADYESAMKIKDSFVISPERLDSPEVKEAAAVCWNELFSDAYLDLAISIKNHFPISPEKEEEIALKNLIICLSKGNDSSAIQIINNFAISAENLNSPEIEKAAGICLDKLLRNDLIRNGLKIKDSFNISSEKAEDTALKNLKSCLAEGDGGYAIEIKNNFSISPEKLYSSEVEKAALWGLIDNLSDGKLYETFIIKDNFSISFENLNSSEVEEAALAGMRHCLLNNYLDDAIKIKDNFKIFPEKLIDIVLESTSDNLWSGMIGSLRARKIVNAFAIPLEEMLQKYFSNSSPKERRSIEFIGAILNSDERKEMLQKFGPEAEILFQSGEIKTRKKFSGEKREEIISNFKKKIIDSIEDGSEARIFNKLAFVIKELDNQRKNDEQSTADFLFEISKDISKKLDDRKFLILIRKLSEINDPKANFFALRLAGQSRVKPLAFIHAIQKLSGNSFIPKVPKQLILEERNGKRQISREKATTLQKIISEYPNQFSTIVSVLADSRFNDFDLVKERETVFSSLNDFKAVTPIIFDRYRKANESGRKELVRKVNQTRPVLFRNQPIKEVFQGKDSEIFTEMVYIAYNPIGMDFKAVENLLGRVKDRTRDLAKYRFPEEGYDFSLDDKKGYRLKPGEEINPQILSKISNIFSGNYPENEDEAKKISGAIAKLAKGGTDLKEAEMASLLSLLAKEEQIKEYRSKIAGTDASPRLILSEAKENLGVYFNDNFSRALEQFLSSNPQSKEKLEAILSRPERLEFIKKKIGKQLEEKNLEIDWGNPGQVVGASFSFFILKKLRQEISKEIKKYELAPEGEGEEMSLNNADLKAYLSKNVGSFFAKASAGICTAENIPLFNREEHFHINIVENNRTVQANIQAYIIDYPPGKKSLLMRGVNPNVKFMKDISVPAFCDKVIKIAKQFQQDNGMAGVYLSEQLGSWHALSNREEVAGYLAGKYLKNDKERKFNYDIVNGRMISKMFEV